MLVNLSFKLHCTDASSGQKMYCDLGSRYMYIHSGWPMVESCKERLGIEVCCSLWQGYCVFGNGAFSDDRLVFLIKRGPK